MTTQKTTFKGSIAKTLLIILGIVVAALLTLNSGLFLSQNDKVGLELSLFATKDHKIKTESANNSAAGTLLKAAGFIYEQLPKTGE